MRRRGYQGFPYCQGESQRSTSSCDDLPSSTVAGNPPKQSYSKGGKGRGQPFERERKAGPLIQWASDHIPSNKVKSLRQPTEIDHWKAAVSFDRNSITVMLLKHSALNATLTIPCSETRSNPRLAIASCQPRSPSHVESSRRPVIRQDPLWIHQGRQGKGVTGGRDRRARQEGRRRQGDYLDRRWRAECIQG
jgi:hypothetical protein